MNKLIFAGFLLLGSFYFSQNVIEKYNSFNNRYEYYDSSGKMIAYRLYNNFSKQWEYYYTDSYRKKQPTQYRDPQQVDISPLGNAAATLQNRYNDSRKNAQSIVDDIVYKIKALNITEKRKNKILDDFNKTVMSNMESLYNGNATWLYDAANTIIKNTVD